MDSRRRGRKRESSVKSVFLILMAAVVVAAAIYIVVNVVGKIKDDYEDLEFTKEETSAVIDLDVKEEEELGWNEADEGWRYLLKKGEYAKDQWLDVEGYLYYFGEDGYMVTGELKQEGQIFTLHQEKGYLKDIQKDWNFLPDAAGENLDSVVKTNAFWCFLQEPEEGSRSLFRVIQYRKTVENKIKTLGDASNPEKTTRYSMKAYGDYLYFLPKVKDSQLPLLSQNEKTLCNKLFRMIPGSDKKEMIADNVDGYLVLDNIIYYAQGGKIYRAESGIEYATGEARYSVVIQDGACYLVDGEGNPAVPETGSSITIGDRLYQLEIDGKISFVRRAEPVVEGRTYYLEGEGSNSSVKVKSEEGNRTLLREPHGVQSYCIVDREIYFSAYVDKDESGQWYSQIYKSGLEGEDKQKVSEKFPGSVGIMYYYEDEGEIYGEYYPAIGKKAYGEAVVITKGGSMFKIEDEEVRTGRTVSGNDRLELVMVKDGKLTAMWQDSSWSPGTGITGTLWSQGIELDTAKRRELELEREEPQEETAPEGSQPEEDVIVRPLESGAYTSPPETAAPTQSPVNRDPLVGTGGPTQETTAPAAPGEKGDEVEIIPLG